MFYNLWRNYMQQYKEYFKMFLRHALYPAVFKIYLNMFYVKTVLSMDIYRVILTCKSLLFKNSDK